MKNKRMSLLLWGAISLVTSALVAEPQAVPKYDRDLVTFGCTVRLKHGLTGKYLTVDDDRYDHPGTSGQIAVYAGADNKTDKALWIIKGCHSGDRWNFALNWDTNFRSMIGWPVRRGQILRFENVATGRELHSHGARSPKTGQGEVTAFGDNGMGDTNDNFVVDANDAGSGFEYLADGYKVKFRHANSNRTLHSHGIDWKPGKQEVTTYAGRDDNDWWVIELAVQPDKNEKIKPIYDKTRSTQLSYWTPLFWDAEADRCDEKHAERRVWTHGGSRHDGGNNPPPHDHLELILGPWGDQRTQQGPSFFAMHNADDKFKTGPIQFGDRIKIMSVFGGGGEEDKKGLLLPFRYLWMLEQSRFGAPHREIVITRPEHGQTQDDGAIFVLEPVIAGQSGAISSMDLVRIRNVKTGAYIWTHGTNRWGPQYWEILADKGDEDKWGRNQYGTERRIFWGEYRFSSVLPTTVSNDGARRDLEFVNREIEKIIGEVKAKETQARLAEVAKKNEELAKLLEKQRLDAEEAEKKRIEALTALAAKADGEKAAAIKAEQEKASQALEAANKALVEAKKQAEEDAKKKVSEAEAKAKADADKAALIAAELMHKLDLPIGFITMPGKPKSIAIGLQDREVEVAVDNRGTKRKVVSFDDFAVVVLDDGTLGQLLPSADPSNPWQRVNLVDAKGVAIKAAGAAVGCDGTTYVISQDGKSLYGITWPGDTPAVQPNPSKGFEAADKKGEHREKNAKRRGHKKGGKKGKKRAGADKDKDKDEKKKDSADKLGDKKKQDSKAAGRGKGPGKNADGKKPRDKKEQKNKQSTNTKAVEKHDGAADKIAAHG